MTKQPVELPPHIHAALIELLVRVALKNALRRAEERERRKRGCPSLSPEPDDVRTLHAEKENRP